MILNLNTASVLNIVINQGTTASWQFAVKDDLGVPLDLTGNTVRSQFRVGYGGRVMFELTSSTGQITLDEAAGLINFTVDPSLTSRLSFGDAHVLTGVYDVELTNPGGVVTRLIEGSISIRREVTQ